MFSDHSFLTQLVSHRFVYLLPKHSYTNSTLHWIEDNNENSKPGHKSYLPILLLREKLSIYIALRYRVAGTDSKSSIAHLNRKPELKVEQADLTHVLELATRLTDFRLLISRISSRSPSKHSKRSRTNLTLFIEIRFCLKHNQKNNISNRSKPWICDNTPSQVSSETYRKRSCTNLTIITHFCLRTQPKTTMSNQFIQTLIKRENCHWESKLYHAHVRIVAETWLADYGKFRALPSI